MTLQRGPTGKLLRGPGGKLANNANCCCDETPPDPCDCETGNTPCEVCECTPDCLTLTLSGLTDCPCGEQNTFHYVSAAVLNGVHHLQHVNSCLWSLTITDGLERRNFSAPGCADENYTDSDFFDITITFGADDGPTNWQLVINSVAAQQSMFSGETLIVNCSFMVIANDFAEDDCGDLFGNTLIRAYGGTATLEACCE